MSGDARFSKVSCVTFERILPGPVERLWDHLTRPELLPGWFGKGAIEARLGGTVDLMGGHIRGTLTQWSPPRRLAYSWNVLSPGEISSSYPESYLAFALEPRGDDVHLRLAHLPILPSFEKQNAMGWHSFLDMLGDALRGEKVEERAIYMRRNAERYGVDLHELAR
jgi:uncharacterized protein YndB with AHSA1/START domain